MQKHRAPQQVRHLPLRRLRNIVPDLVPDHLGVPGVVAEDFVGDGVGGFVCDVVLVEPGDGVAVGEAEEGACGRLEVRVELREEGGGGGVCEELGDGFTDLERGGGVLG